MQQRVLLYSHDTFGLGHTQRTISIAEAILEHEPSAKVLYVTGSPVIQNLKPPHGMDYVKLPSATKIGPENYAPRSLTLTFSDLLRMRAKLIVTIAEEFQPDIFLVDHAPIGMSGEILPALRSLKKSGAKVALGLRDILDDPASVTSVWERQRIIEFMREFYDLILVYGMAEFYDPVREYKLPADLGDKARFTGYVYRTRSVQSSKEVRSRLQVPEGQFVLATVGGGEDSYPVLQMIAGALHLSPISGFSTLITTGPMCPEGARQALMREEGEKVRVTEFVNDLPSAIAAADLVVSMGGYNSVCEILAFGRRAIVIPRTAPRREQLIRASVLASHGFVTLLNPNECTPVVLRETIEDTLANKAEPLLERRDMVKLDGAQRAANYLLDLAS